MGSIWGGLWFTLFIPTEIGFDLENNLYINVIQIKVSIWLFPFMVLSFQFCFLKVQRLVVPECRRVVCEWIMTLCTGNFIFTGFDLGSKKKPKHFGGGFVL